MLASDDFNRSDRELGDDPEWIELNTSTSRNLRIENGVVIQEAANNQHGACIWATPCSGYEQFSEGVVGGLPDGSAFSNAIGPWINGLNVPSTQPADWNGYTAQVRPNDGRVRIERAAGPMAQVAIGPITEPMFYRIESKFINDDFTISLFINGDLVTSYVDSAGPNPNAIYVGVRNSWGLGGWVDDWVGGDLGGEEPEPPLIDTSKFFHFL